MMWFDSEIDKLQKSKKWQLKGFVSVSENQFGELSMNLEKKEFSAGGVS